MAGSAAPRAAALITTTQAREACHARASRKVSIRSDAILVHAGHALSAAQGVFMPYLNKFPARDFSRATRGFIGAVWALAI